MSAKVYTPVQLRWFAAGYGIIAQRYEKLLETPEYEEIIDELMEPDEHWVEGAVSESKATKKEKAARKEFLEKLERCNNRRDKAKWRWALNLYKAGRYYEASPMLEFICAGND